LGHIFRTFCGTPIANSGAIVGPFLGNWCSTNEIEILGFWPRLANPELVANIGAFAIHLLTFILISNQSACFACNTYSVENQPKAATQISQHGLL
jgi:hypothetical protein